MYGRIEEDGIVHDHLSRPTGWKMQGEKATVDVWVHSEVEQSASLVLTRHVSSGMWGVWESNWNEYWRNVSFVKGFNSEESAKAFLWDRLQYLQRQVPTIARMIQEEDSLCD
jgi:hypothetical protein